MQVTVTGELRIDAHRHRLLQAFTNIVQNAYEAYDRPRTRGRIEIAARRRGEHVAIRFADNGCGMSEEARCDAFKLYSTKKPDGTGFGLPLAKKIVETEHRGSIELVSEKGGGTTVTVVLPIAQEDPP